MYVPIYCNWIYPVVWYMEQTILLPLDWKFWISPLHYVCIVKSIWKNILFKAIKLGMSKQLQLNVLTTFVILQIFFPASDLWVKLECYLCGRVIWNILGTSRTIPWSLLSVVFKRKIKTLQNFFLILPYVWPKILLN